MSIIITSGAVRERIAAESDWERKRALFDAAEREKRRLHFHNGVAWFLDGLLGQLDPTLPRHIFSQAVGPSTDAPDPGDIDAPTCQRIADLIEKPDREQLAAAVLAAYAPADGDDPEPGVEIALRVARLVREIAETSDVLTVS
jgi:hypothetical protein